MPTFSCHVVSDAEPLSTVKSLSWRCLKSGESSYFKRRDVERGTEINGVTATELGAGQREVSGLGR